MREENCGLLPDRKRLPTPRQREVMLLAAQGLSNKQIARRLSIYEGTVKMHLHKIYDRLGVRNRTALTVYVHRFAEATSEG